MVRVLVADDHDLVREGIVTLLKRTDDIDVVGTAENGREAVTLAGKLLPDVIVMDINMPVLDGFQALKEIKALDISAHVVILSMHGNNNLVKQALRAGAVGYVLKRAAVQELAQAIQAVEQGKQYLSQSLLSLFSSDNPTQ